MRNLSRTTYYVNTALNSAKTILIASLLVLFFQSDALSQKQAFFAPADTLDKVRFYSGLGIGVSSFTATSIGLYNSWYKQFDQSAFHLFNDWSEWQGMDKMGHAYTSYNLCNIGYQGARWTGISKRGGLLIAGIGSTAIQTTIEIMDGFSTKWGFSVGDVVFNTFGTGLFLAQETYLDEQIIRMKISSSRVTYPDDMIVLSNGAVTSIQERSQDLYGTGNLERFLKDYNAQTIWLSANIYSFFPREDIPKWLNIAFGYSAENMLGGFENAWQFDGQTVSIPQADYPRYHQFILSFDADLNRIKTKNHFVNTLLALINSYKMPAPAVEYNSLGEWRFYLIYRG